MMVNFPKCYERVRIKTLVFIFLCFIYKYIKVYYVKMALFSADLNVIQDSITKVSDKIVRDYVEIGNLQNSHKGCVQFADMLVDFIKKKLYEYFKSKKPSYDIMFQGESYNEADFNSNMRYLISPLCGKINLIHAIPYFSVSVALMKKMNDGGYKTICGVIDNPITQETFAVEEGKGAYVNSRRIRVSSRSSLDDALVVIKNFEDKEFMSRIINKYKNLMVTNCEVLNICNVASGKYDIAVLKKSAVYQELSLLMVKEAGGLVKKMENGELVVCNDLLYSQI